MLVKTKLREASHGPENEDRQMGPDLEPLFGPIWRPHFQARGWPRGAWFRAGVRCAALVCYVLYTCDVCVTKCPAHAPTAFAHAGEEHETCASVAVP